MGLPPVTDNAMASGPLMGGVGLFPLSKVTFFFTSCLISISWGDSRRLCTWPVSYSLSH